MAAHVPHATLVWLRLMRVYQQIDHATSELMREHDLTVSRFDVLDHAGSPEGQTQQQLADALLVTKGNVCQLLDGMERDGLVRRERDGRANRIFLTDHGRDKRRAAIADQQRHLDDAFASLSSDQLRSLAALLRTVDRHL